MVRKKQLTEYQAKELAYEMITEYLHTFTHLDMGYGDDIWGRLDSSSNGPYATQYNYEFVDEEVKRIISYLNRKHLDAMSKAKW